MDGTSRLPSIARNASRYVSSSFLRSSGSPLLITVKLLFVDRKGGQMLFLLMESIPPPGGMRQTHREKMAVLGPNLKVEKSSRFPDSRGQTILSAIINEHFLTGEPVGSKTVAEKFANASGLSPATIRSVMGELEELGLLEQPHTSAGRVPTDRGYRFFVDNLLGVLSVSNADLRLISDEFGFLESELQETPDRLMERTSQLLSALSNNIGIVVSPSLANDRLQHIEFVNLSERRILVVLVSAPNIVHNRIIRLTETYAQDELDRTARYLNQEFGGKSLAEIRGSILKLMHEEKALFDKLL